MMHTLFRRRYFDLLSLGYLRALSLTHDTSKNARCVRSNSPNLPTELEVAKSNNLLTCAVFFLLTRPIKQVLQCTS